MALIPHSCKNKYRPSTPTTRDAFESHIRSIQLNATAGGVVRFQTAIASDGTVSWNTTLPTGVYVLLSEDGEATSKVVHIHDGLALNVPSSPLRLNAAGHQPLVISCTPAYTSDILGVAAIARFMGSQGQTQDVAVNSRGDGKLSLLTPRWQTPHDWYDGCSNRDTPLPSATCVPDLPATLRVSLDGGKTFLDNALSVLFVHKPKLKVGFLYTGPVDDDGWTHAHNQGRIALEAMFGGLIDARTYVENVPGGEFVGQPQAGSTIASGTPVSPNSTYAVALGWLKQFCDEDFDLVFTTSFGFQSQVLDVSSGYPQCWLGNGRRHVGDHSTYFALATGTLTNERTSTMFGKVYQTKYLA